MAISFGHRWTANYGSVLNGSELSEAAKIWQKGLADLEIDDIKNGLNVMANSGEEWPPSMPQFIEMCKASQAAGLTHNTAAYKEYIGKDRQLTHKCDPDKANDALAAMKRKLGMN